MLYDLRKTGNMIDEVEAATADDALAYFINKFKHLEYVDFFKSVTGDGYFSGCKNDPEYEIIPESKF